MEYTQRILDKELDKMLASLPAICLEGAKGVGKTATARQRTDVVFPLDDEDTYSVVAGNPTAILQGAGTVFIDEWQLVPSVWNTVRHAVDDGAAPGRFLLAGSAAPHPQAKIHSGAGRIVRMMMRPLSLPERGIEQPTVSMGSLLDDETAAVEGVTSLSVVDYVQEILDSGFPGIRRALPEARPYLLRGHLDQIVDHDVEEMGARIRRPASVRGWLNAYAAATATTTSQSAILQAATPGQDEIPSRPTATAYRDLLQRMWLLDPVPAWMPSLNHFSQLAQSPKHHLVDPALAATAIGATADSLIRGKGSTVKQDGTFLGALFESLAVQTVRVLAQVHGCTVSHFRVRGGAQEVDIIVERPDRRIVAMEVKLSQTVRPADVTGLNWLASGAPDLILDRIVLTTGQRAYRRPDGIAVVPLALLGV